MERLTNNEQPISHERPEASVVGYPMPPQEPPKPTLITDIETVRQELQQLQAWPDEGGVSSEPVVLEGIEPPEPTPIGILREKQVRRKQKEVKERAPRQFSEMLVVFNDTQLLRQTDQEALGAFLQYVEANKDRITHLVANGDIVDFEAQSGFDKSLDAMNSAGDEIEAARWLVDHLSGLLPGAKKVWIQGNHEHRWHNMIEAERGNEPWIRTPEEMFGLTDNNWQTIPYEAGQYYQWHDRIFWHGHRAGAKSNIPKLEMEDAGVSVTTAHINRNMMYESTDAVGNRKVGITHGGFSKDNLHFMKKAATGWAQGFGVYYYDKATGEQPYLIHMSHGKPRFISPEGQVFDGTGFEIPGFETPTPKRGRPPKR